MKGKMGMIGLRVGRSRGGGKATMGEHGVGRNASSTPRAQVYDKKAL